MRGNVAIATATEVFRLIIQCAHMPGLQGAEPRKLWSSKHRLKQELGALEAPPSLM